MMKKMIMKKVIEDISSKKRNKKSIEIKEDNSSLINNLEESNFNIKDIEISELIPSVIDNVIVYVDDNLISKEVIQDLPYNMGGISFRNWRNGIGGVFTRDVRLYLLNKPYGKYAIISNKDERIIIRLIDDEELRTFSTLNLLDGKIKDKAYMIFKRLKENEKPSASKRYIEENIHTMTEEKIPLSISNETHDEDGEKYSGTSISLFSD
jgi:hypothetical protein